MTKDGFEKAKKLEKRIEILKVSIDKSEFFIKDCKYDFNEIVVKNGLQSEYKILCTKNFNEEFKVFIEKYIENMKIEISEKEIEFEKLV